MLVGLLWFVALLNYLDRQMLSTMKPSMMGDIPELESAANFGRLMAVFLWIYGWMSPVAGMVADRVGKKRIIVGSLFVWSAVTLGMGYAKTFDQLYALRALMGVSEALYMPAGLALIAEHHDSKTRSLAVGIHMTGIYMGQALGGFGATIAHEFSWQTAFHSFGFIGMAYAILLAFLLRDDTSSHSGTASVQSVSSSSQNPFRGIRILLTNPAFWVILFFFAIPSLPGWAVKNWMPTLFSEHLGIEMKTAGPLSTITIAGSSFLGVIVGGLLSDRWVAKNLKGRVYTSAIGLALTVPALLFIGLGHGLFSVVSAAFCFGFGFGMFDANNMPILCQFVSPKHRATAYGLMNMTGVFAGAFITDWLGRSSDAGRLGRDFALMAVVVLVALAVQLLFLKPQSHDFAES
jgi:MFS family permease